MRRPHPSRSCSVRRRPVQARAYQHPFRLSGRRLWWPRSYAVSALCRARRDVLSRPSGAACAQPLSAVPIRHQAARLQDAHRASASIAPPADQSHSRPTTFSMAAGSPIFRPASRLSARPLRIGIYDIPKVDVTTVALHSRGVTAGSMRGYGTLQTMTALEVLIDEAAASLPLDPIEFRRRNALTTGGRTMTGNPVLRLDPHARDSRQARKASDLAAARRRRKRARQQGVLVGTGVACATKNFGTGADCTLARSRSIPTAASRSTATRSRWATASAPRWPIGSRSSRRRGRRSHGGASRCVRALGLVTSGDPYTMNQADAGRGSEQSALGARNQFGDSASIGAHVGTHAAAEAARVIFRFGLWPAALELWGIAPTDPRARQWDAGALAGRPARHAGAAAAAVGGASRRRRMRATA